jgi:hypothetical protein
VRKRGDLDFRRLPCVNYLSDPEPPGSGERHQPERDHLARMALLVARRSVSHRPGAAVRTSDRGIGSHEAALLGTPTTSKSQCALPSGFLLLLSKAA